MSDLTNLTDGLSVLQDAITTRLKSKSAFSAATVRSEQDGDTEEQVAKVAGSAKILVTVALPDLEKGTRHTARKVVSLIQIEENVQRNRTGSGFKTARSLAMEVQDALCGWGTAMFAPFEFNGLRVIRQSPTLLIHVTVTSQVQLSQSS